MTFLKAEVAFLSVPISDKDGSSGLMRQCSFKQ